MCDILIAVFFEGYLLIVCNREGKKKTKLELSSLGVHVATALTARVDKAIYQSKSITTRQVNITIYLTYNLFN